MGQYKTALLIGRFQPFHKGHLFLFKKTFDNVDKLLIGIGSPRTIDEQNPYSYKLRREMIEMVLDQEGWNKRIVAILPITDYLEDDQLWLRKTMRTVLKRGKFDVFIGNDDWTAGIFEKNEYKVWRTGFYKRYLLEGKKIRKLMKEGKKWENRTPAYLVKIIKKKYKYSHIVLGGTFDHFHKGHKKLIDLAFKYGNKVSIGITTDSFVKGKLLSSSIQIFNVRKNEVVDYLKEKKYYFKAMLVKISDIYGSVLKDKTIDAMVVSEETYPKALKINILRKIKKLRPLKIITAPFVYGDDGKVISSERIRMGEINREGHSYMKIFEGKEKLVLPESLRNRLRQPLGKVIEGLDNELKQTAMKTLQSFNQLKHPMVIAVGDIVTMSLLNIGFDPDIKIIDLRSRRKDINYKNGSPEILSRLNSPDLVGVKHKVSKNFDSPFFESKNKPGTISQDASNKIQKMIKLALLKKLKPWLIVKGEEDLLTLPAILLAPLNSIVLYGQFDLGVVAVEVTEKKKNEVETILSQFC